MNAHPTACRARSNGCVRRCRGSGRIGRFTWMRGWCCRSICIACGRCPRGTGISRHGGVQSKRGFPCPCVVGRGSPRPTPEGRGQVVAASILRASQSGRGGSRGACAVLLGEPGQAWVCEPSGGVAVFVDPSGHSGGIGGIGVGRRSWRRRFWRAVGRDSSRQCELNNARGVAE